MTSQGKGEFFVAWIWSMILSVRNALMLSFLFLMRDFVPKLVLLTCSTRFYTVPKIGLLYFHLVDVYCYKGRVFLLYKTVLTGKLQLADLLIRYVFLYWIFGLYAITRQNKIAFRKTINCIITELSDDHIFQLHFSVFYSFMF